MFFFTINMAKRKFSKAFNKRKLPKKHAKTMVVTPRRALRSFPTANRASFAGSGFPLVLKITHKWHHTFEQVIDGSLSAVGVNCIGMFKPDAIGVLARQPMYFDQMSALYSRYTVIASKCKFTIINQPVTAQPPYKVVGFINENSTGGITDFNALCEYHRAKPRVSQGGLNPDRVVVTLNWSTKKHNPGSIMANSLLAGTAANNPLESPRFQLNLTNMVSTSPQDLLITAEVSYIAVWDELKEIAAS